MTEENGFPDYLNVDYTDGEGESPEDYTTLDRKTQKAIEVTTKALEEYRNPAVMWTGGKDSTLTLYFIKEVADEYGYEMPPAVFIDHFQHFDDITEFVERWADDWGVELVYARNDDVRAHADEPGDEVSVDDLNEQNQHHVRNILEYEEETFPFLLDTYVGNHLLKTVPLNNAIEELEVDGIISGVRWDEQEARADETFFSPRHDPDVYPPHDRVHPILQFDEGAVWDASGTSWCPKLSRDTPKKATFPKDTTTCPKESSATTSLCRPSTSRALGRSVARFRRRRARPNPLGYRTWRVQPSAPEERRTRRT